tara:strand:- start:380 stop:502 length:123 start_codon:yes stop_codon:yes gene_type:complete
MNDELLGAAVGATLTLSILECVFWGVVVWMIIRDKRSDEE